MLPAALHQRLRRRGALGRAHGSGGGIGRPGPGYRARAGRRDPRRCPKRAGCAYRRSVASRLSGLSGNEPADHRAPRNRAISAIRRRCGRPVHQPTAQKGTDSTPSSTCIEPSTKRWTNSRDAVRPRLGSVRLFGQMSALPTMLEEDLPTPDGRLAIAGGQRDRSAPGSVTSRHSRWAAVRRRLSCGSTHPIGSSRRMRPDQLPARRRSH